MTYRDIVAVTGMPGLFQLLANKSDGAIVRALEDNSSRFLPARLHRVTPLDTIEVYTVGDNVRLQQVFEAMQTAEGTQALPGAGASKAELRSYFGQVFPDYDESRVYDSDLKKMVRWYSILKKEDLLTFEAESPVAVEENVEDGTQMSAGEEGHNAARGQDDALSGTDDMPGEGAAQLKEEGEGDQVENTGLVEDATAGKAPRAKKATEGSPEASGPKVKSRSTKSAEAGGAEVSLDGAVVEGTTAPDGGLAKKSRAKKSVAEGDGDGADTPKKVARKKKDEEA